MAVTMTLWELAAVVGAAVGLATTDAAAVSRLGVAFVAKKLGIKPAEVMKYDRATDGSGDE